jgi:small GTP-binding protein
MDKKNTRSRQQPNSRLTVPAHPALKLRHTLKGHTDNVYRMAISPDGSTLASPSQDGSVRLWNIKSGAFLRKLDLQPSVICVGWSPDSRSLAAGTTDLSIWEAATGTNIKTLPSTGGSRVLSIAWSPDGSMLAWGSGDGNISVWDTVSDDVRQLKKHSTSVHGLVWSPDGARLCSGSIDFYVALWNVKEGREISSFRVEQVLSGAWSPDGDYIALGFFDHTIKIWDPETGKDRYVLEGHTGEVASVSFMDSGRLLASMGAKGTTLIWRTDTWQEVFRVQKIGDVDLLSNLATHPTGSTFAALGKDQKEIHLWDLDLALLRGASTAPAIFYVNAKAVLLGESGVGKSGLGIRIAEKKFRKTKSTHGAQFWHFPTDQLPTLPKNVQAELTLWDLAGQPEYRLTHQLFLDDTDAALLLFDCADPQDPFRGVPYWAKVLKKNAPAHAKKFLISARSDVSPVTVDRPTINRILALYGLDEYFKTSAHTGEGVEILFQRLMSEIPWETLPRTSTPMLFQVLREYLLERKQAGDNLISMEEVDQAAGVRFTERAIEQAETNTVIRLLQSRGLVHRLEPRPGQVWILLKPERINQYGASIIQAARNHPEGIGAVSERDVLTSNIPFTGFERLPLAEETLVLDGTVELLIRRDLGFREMGNLVFPSQINVSRQPPDDLHLRTEVAYRFSGSIETIYASLVVRLNYTNHFRREDQWKYAVEFSRAGNRLGFSMKQIEEGTGELEIYFQHGITDFDRVTFIRFITDHLQSKGIDIHEQIRLYCPKCSNEVTNREAIETRVRDGKLDIPCQFCGTAVVIPKSVEEIYRRDPSLGETQQQLAATVKKRTEAEVKQFQLDQQQYTATEDDRIHILHLSDLHFTNNTLAGVWRTQLETDLIEELEIRRLEYLIISGDIGNYSTEKEYDIAFAMVDGLVKQFGLDASRVVIVPGNHDLNWDLSEKAYPFVSKRKLPDPLPEDQSISAGEAGVLLRNDTLYRERFANFNTYFYRRIYTGQDYPLEYENQYLFVERPEDHILFLGLNSSWQLDHHFRKRADINISALTNALTRLQGGKYKGWLKVAVWHHPVTGKEMMNDDFMQLLAVHGFQICMHGHIHEAKGGFYNYDDQRNIHIIGTGTFGAPAHEQVTGIPLQYNLMTFDSTTGEMTVNTRKKEKVDGAWSADARWGNKKRPDPFYSFNVPNYVASKPYKH